VPLTIGGGKAGDALSRAGKAVSRADGSRLGRTRLHDIEKHVEDVVVNNVRIDAQDMCPHTLSIGEGEFDDLATIRNQFLWAQGSNGGLKGA
jgi:hypothetical protein